MRSPITLQQLVLGLCGMAIGLSSLSFAQSQQKAEDLLEQCYLASGGDHWSRLAQAEISGAFSLGGAAGTFHQVVDLQHGQDVAAIHIGPIQEEQGTLTDSSWEVDRGGVVNVHDGPEAKADAITESFQDRNGWFHPTGNRLSFDGERVENGKRYEIVTVTPPGGRSMTLWLDAEDHLLRRLVQEDANHQQSTMLFSDYRGIDGVLYPFSMRQTDGDVGQDTVQIVQTIQFSPTVEQKAFEAPVSKIVDASLAHGKSKVVVPFTLADSRILIPISIDGHTALPFLLDTGGRNYITPQTASLLGVSGIGNIPLNGTGSEQENAQLAVIKQLRIDAIKMEDQQFTVGPLPAFLENRGKDPPIAGLVGYELLQRFPVTIDYQKLELTFYKPGYKPGSTLPAPRASQALRLYFDGQDPILQVGIDGTPGYFGIDTGDSSGTTIFGAFYRAHRFPVQLPAQERAEGGIGGMGKALLTRVDTLSFGSLDLQRPLVNLNFARKGAFSEDYAAGNLGYDVLKNFVITLDYEHRQAFLVRSSDFGKPLPYNRSGMVLTKAPAGDIVIEILNPDTPASLAGLAVGDAILSIGGQDQGYDQLLSSKAGTKLTVKYKRKGKKASATMRLQELLPSDGQLRPMATASLSVAPE